MRFATSVIAVPFVLLAACGGPQTSQANNAEANISNSTSPPATANASNVSNAMVMLAAKTLLKDQALAIMHDAFCSASPEPQDPGLPEWQLRLIDGRKCWFRADKLVPKEDLIWSYEPRELDEGGVVTGRHHYT